MPWCDAKELNKAIASLYRKKDASDLGIELSLFSAAITTAKQDILDALEMRGYTQTEVEGGDRLSEFHLNHAIFRFFNSPGMAVPMDRDALNSFDRVKMVSQKNYGWRVGGKIIWPGMGAVQEEAAGTVGYGQTSMPAPPSYFADW